MRKALLILSLCLPPFSLKAAYTSVPWVTHGGAYTHEVGPQGWVQLTDANGGEAGAAWNPCPINISADFSLAFDINLGNRTCGADGMSFVLQSNGSSQVPGGNAGMQGYENIFNSLSVAFDTYSNTSSPYNDPVYDSLDVRTNGALQSATPLSCGGNGPTLTGSTCGRPQMLASSTNAKDGANHHVVFDWSAATGTLNVTIDGSLRATYIFGASYVSSIFNNNANVTYGWTASTGGSYNVQEFAQTSPNPGSCQATPTAVVWTPIPTVTNPCGSPTPIPSFTNTPSQTPYYSPSITPTPPPPGCGLPVFQEAKLLTSGCMGSTGTVTTGTYSFTYPPNQLLVLRMCTNANTSTPTNVMFGGSTMTLFASSLVGASDTNYMYTYYLANPPTTGTISFNYANANCSWNIATELYNNVDMITPVGGTTVKVGGNASATSPYPFTFNFTTSGPFSLVSVFITSDQIQNTADKPISASGATDMGFPTSGSPKVDGGGGEAVAGSYKAVGGAGTCAFTYDLNQASRWWDAQPMEIRGNSCGTPSFTPTTTGTASITPSPSPSFTGTPTRSASPSPTGTPTQTASDTPSASRTATATQSATATASPSRTATFTTTGTNTMGPSPTSTATPTASASATGTATPSPSRTASPTQTDSPTQTPTVTLTTPFSPTDTPTISVTFTHTATSSLTQTFSDTASATETPSITLTVSASDTPSSSATSSVSPSPSDTATASPSLTESPTLSDSPTPSSSATTSPTTTVSPSFTESFTVSPTPVAAPHQVKLAVYNSAGELVRVLFNGAAQYQLGQLVLDRGLILGGLDQVHITFPGYLRDPQGGTSTAGLNWAGDNAAGQIVKSGVYTIKAEIVDQFGQTTTLQESVQVLDANPENSLSIYNSAGERVAQIPLPASGTGRFDSLRLPVSTFGSKIDQATGTLAGSGFEVVLKDEKGTEFSVFWDGLTSQGLPVSSGSYTAELIYSAPGAAASRVVETKGFVVIQAGAFADLEDAYVYPNPVVKGAAISVRYTASPGSTAVARLYTLSGELVGETDDRAHKGVLSFPPKSLASGVFIVDVEKLNGRAVLARCIRKVAVVR